MLLLSCKDKKANLFIRNTPNKKTACCYFHAKIRKQIYLSEIHPIKKILPAHVADRIFYFTYPVPDTYCADSYTPAQSPS